MHLPEKERVDFGIFTKEQAELAISTLRTMENKVKQSMQSTTPLLPLLHLQSPLLKRRESQNEAENNRTARRLWLKLNRDLWDPNPDLLPHFKSQKWWSGIDGSNKNDMDVHGMEPLSDSEESDEESQDKRNSQQLRECYVPLMPPAIT